MAILGEGVFAMTGRDRISFETTGAAHGVLRPVRREQARARGCIGSGLRRVDCAPVSLLIERYVVLVDTHSNTYSSLVHGRPGAGEST